MYNNKEYKTLFIFALRNNLVIKTSEVCKTNRSCPSGWMTRFVHKMGQMGPKWDRSGTFSDRAKMY